MAQMSNAAYERLVEQMKSGRPFDSMDGGESMDTTLRNAWVCMLSAAIHRVAMDYAERHVSGSVEEFSSGSFRAVWKRHAALADRARRLNDGDRLAPTDPAYVRVKQIKSLVESFDGRTSTTAEGQSFADRIEREISCLEPW